VNLRRYQTSLALLLIAGILFGSVMPPVVQHTHVDGHEDHDHHSTKVTADSHGNHHGHSHGHAHRLAAPEESKAAAKSDSSHLHLSLFGLELSIPADNTSDSTSNEPRNHFDGDTLVHWMNRDLHIAMSTSADFQWCPLLSCTFGETSNVETALLPEGHQRTQSALILCDTARRERSGVQKI